MKELAVAVSELRLRRDGSGVHESNPTPSLDGERWAELERLLDEWPDQEPPSAQLVDVANELVQPLMVAVEKLREKMSNELPRVVKIDGSKFDDLEGFYDEVGSKLLLNSEWGRNLDALNDCLRGSFTTRKPWILRWVNASRSRERLGHEETCRWLRATLSTCHPSNVSSVRERLEQAERNEGDTLFDVLVDIIRVHGPGGADQDDGVILEIEE